MWRGHKFAPRMCDFAVWWHANKSINSRLRITNGGPIFSNWHPRRRRRKTCQNFLLFFSKSTMSTTSMLIVPLTAEFTSNLDSTHSPRGFENKGELENCDRITPKMERTPRFRRAFGNDQANFPIWKRGVEIWSLPWVSLQVLAFTRLYRKSY